MLMLGRRKGEKIIIGEDIIITFVGYDEKWQCAKIGIDAPQDVTIVREEIQGLREPKYLDKDDLKCLLKHNTKL